MVTVNPKIFKAYDIRGIYGQDFDEALAYKLGQAFVAFRRQEIGQEDLQLVVGADMRLSSPVLKEQLIKGLSEAGATVIDIGLCSTPTFYFAVAHYNYDGGIMVSASHNPKEYNGFKITRAKASCIGRGDGLEKIQELALGAELPRAAQPGQIVAKENVVADQLEHDLVYVDFSKIKPFKVVADPANAMGSQYLAALFQKLPGELITMNWELDGSFPNHEADPFKPENVRALGERVVAEKADLGIATDGDGDRIFFVDDLGRPVEAGITRAILCKLFLQDKPGSKIAYDIRPGRITRDVIIANGGEPVVTKVGHTLIKQTVVETGAYFAGESSGHFFINSPEGCYEMPMVMVMKILQELSSASQTLSQYIADYQKYFHSGEINTQVSDAQAKISEIREKYRSGQQNELDGITVEYPDYWFNVRASNTEPILRLTVEGTSKEIMEQKRDELLAIIQA